jgi:peroxiredoxin
MSIIGFAISLAGFLSYFIMMGAFHSFTYNTWIFDSIVLLGVAASLWPWLSGNQNWLSVGAWIVAIVWFVVSRLELNIPGSKMLLVQAGDQLPAMSFRKIDGTQVTEQDLIANSPALLSLYRGWWCPSSKLQLDEIMQNYEHLADQGFRIFAASVDSPEDSASLQEYVGEKITILCDLSTDVLDKIGVHDERGIPWIEQLTSDKSKVSIAMPTAFLINPEGIVTYVSRSRRVDDRPRLDEIIKNLSKITSV